MTLYKSKKENPNLISSVTYSAMHDSNDIVYLFSPQILDDFTL